MEAYRNIGIVQIFMAGSEMAGRGLAVRGGGTGRIVKLIAHILQEKK